MPSRLDDVGSALTHRQRNMIGPVKIELEAYSWFHKQFWEVYAFSRAIRAYKRCGPLMAHVNAGEDSLMGPVVQGKASQSLDRGCGKTFDNDSGQVIGLYSASRKGQHILVQYPDKLGWFKAVVRFDKLPKPRNTELFSLRVLPLEESVRNQKKNISGLKRENSCLGGDHGAEETQRKTVRVKGKHACPAGVVEQDWPVPRGVQMKCMLLRVERAKGQRYEAPLSHIKRDKIVDAGNGLLGCNVDACGGTAIRSASRHHQCGTNAVPRRICDAYDEPSVRELQPVEVVTPSFIRRLVPACDLISGDRRRCLG